MYFDPRGSREPRRYSKHGWGYQMQNFDPRGSREPRHAVNRIGALIVDFDPRGSREPRLSAGNVKRMATYISIHEALASLD